MFRSSLGYFKKLKKVSKSAYIVAETPLCLACGLKSKPARMLIALVNGGAIVDYRTKDGSTAVHKSVAKNNSEALRTLLDLGASPNYKDSKGLTPLYLTVSQATDVLLTEMLLHDRALVGAQVNLFNPKREDQKYYPVANIISQEQ